MAFLSSWVLGLLLHISVRRGVSKLLISDRQLKTRLNMLEKEFS